MHMQPSNSAEYGVGVDVLGGDSKSGCNHLLRLSKPLAPSRDVARLLLVCEMTRKSSKNVYCVEIWKEGMFARHTDIIPALVPTPWTL